MEERRVSSETIMRPVTWTMHPEVVLTVVKLMRWYLKDGKQHQPLARYAFTMARSLLGVHGDGGKWNLESYWQRRLKDFGIDPETCQVIDQRRWAIAWKILNQKRNPEGGAPWRLHWLEHKAALRESYKSGYQQAEAVTNTVLMPARTRPRASARNPWPVNRRNGWSVRGKDKVAHRHFDARVRTYLADYEEEL